MLTMRFRLVNSTQDQSISGYWSLIVVVKMCMCTQSDDVIRLWQTAPDFSKDVGVDVD